ncbi:peptidase MA family metallohydrolase [Thermomicrobium sp.]
MRRRLRRAIASLLLLAFLALGPSASLAAPRVQFQDLGAVVAFPERIVFTLVATAEQPIERVELRYRPVDGAVTFVARPPVEPGTTITLRYARDMRVNYLPPFIDVAYRWRLVLADGRVVESPEQRLAYRDTRYRWVERSRGPVQLFSAVADPDYVETALTVSERAISLFSQRFGLALSGPVRIVLYPSPEALRTALPLQSEEWIGGVAIPQYRLVLGGVVPGVGAAEELARLLSHEVVHLIVAQATENPFGTPPSWLDEGLATRYQEVAEPWLDAALERARRSGTLPSLRALSASFGTDPEAALLGYAASRSVVDYLLTTYGEEGIARLLAAYRDGISDDEALTRSLGIDVDRLDRAWRAWLAQRASRTRSAEPRAASPLLPVSAAGIVLR